MSTLAYSGDGGPDDGPEGEEGPVVVNLVKATPGLVRVAAVGWWRVSTWAAAGAVSVTGTVVRRTLDGEPPTALLDDAAGQLRLAARRLLDLDAEPGYGAREQQALADRRPDPQPALPGPDGTRDGKPVTAAETAASRDLRSEGAALLRRSADVDAADSTHPAYARILAELMPDEARVLRLLYLEGPQPSVDVRTTRPLGIGSELVAGGLSMIAEHAGCRDPDRIGPYLTNLNRLGMVDFSKEQVENPQRYQLVEAQPKVAEAMKHAGRVPKTVHRSIRLNAFGQDFCQAVLPLDGSRPAPLTRSRAMTGDQPTGDDD
ncbi:DUF4393 domain-containing protein [Rhodococcus aerolatus]